MGAPLPRGMTLHQAHGVLRHVAQESAAGTDFVEHFPCLDARDTTALTVTRLLTNAIGFSARRSMQFELLRQSEEQLITPPAARVALRCTGQDDPPAPVDASCSIFLQASQSTMDKMYGIFHASEMSVTKWKNGGGQTRELARYPRESGYDDFLWRASITDTESDRPFSHYPDVDHTIVLLDGAGLTLRSRNSGALKHVFDQRYSPYEFPGEEEIDATRLGGAVRDFNLMVRRGVARGAVVVWYGPASIDIPETSRLIFVARGEAKLSRVAADEVTVTAEEGVRLCQDTHRIYLTPDAIVLVVDVEFLWPSGDIGADGSET
jgi:uncharacterized protein